MLRALIIFAFLLSACTGPQLPLSKSDPLSPQDPLVQPPWEALVEAGPNAYKDIDFETLDGPNATATTETPVPAQDQIAANSPTEKQVIKSVAIVSIKGAKGAGNSELTAALKTELQKAGWPVAAKKQGDTILISATIKFANDPEGERITIIWFVKTPDGRPMGDVKQENIVPKNSVNAGFGEAAPLIAEGAANGIFELVGKFQQ
jgi:hypothetical protein